LRYKHETRFHGVFAPTSRLRAKVVPPPPSSPQPQPSTTSSSSSLSSSSLSSSPSPPSSVTEQRPPAARSTYRLDWAALLKRVFAIDVMVCARCEGPMRVIACLEEPAVVARILRPGRRTARG